MWNNVKALTAAIVFLGAASLLAQDAAIPPGAVNINLPDNSPLALKSFTMADSRATARGPALALDLQMSATLVNSGPYRIHGVTLRVVAQEVTLGGKGSVTYHSLNVAPGQTFQRRLAIQLMRPSQGNVEAVETLPLRMYPLLLRPPQCPGAPLFQVVLEGPARSHIEAGIGDGALA